MNSDLTAYITLICTSAVLNLYLCLNVFIKRHHYKNIAHLFIIYSGSITIYCFASAFGLMATTLEQIKFWTVIQYVGMPVSAPMGLLFIMQYLGMNITKKRYLSLLIIPVISLVIVATNDFHHLHYRVFKIDPILGAPYLQQEIGLWYLIHGIFLFSCMFIAFFLVLTRWKETAKVYRPQLITLLFGQLVPMLTAFLYLVGLTPSGIDPVPMVLWLSSLFYLWTINSSRMFTLMPIAKEAIFNSINDGVMVVDDFHRLNEFNQAARRMFPSLNESMYGMDFEEVWLALSGVAFPSTLGTPGTTHEIHLVTDYWERYYQVRTSTVENDKKSKGQLIIFTDITELKRLQMKLEHQAFYDELTGIFNRRAFFQKCEQEFSAAKIEASPYTVVLIDIDFFKKVNDTYGHNVGDQTLMHVVNVVKSELMPGVLFARYGGEEFVLAFKESRVGEGEALANRLRRCVEKQHLLTSEGVISVTLSSGVAQTTTDPKETLFQLLNNADKALYSAKREGRNRVCVYTGA